MQLRDFVEGEGYTYREMAVAAGYQSRPGGNFERGIVLAPKVMPSAIMIKMNLAKGPMMIPFARALTISTTLVMVFLEEVINDWSMETESWLKTRICQCISS